MPIDTSAVPLGSGGRRALRFESIDRMLTDARVCVAADRSPRGLQRRGNWTIGQALNHIAAWIEYPFIGYPQELVIPSEMKAQAGALKHRLMHETMQPGERLPVEGSALAAGTLATEIVPADVGLARLEAAAELLRVGDPHRPAPIPDPALGVVTLYEWTLMTLRHAELHLGFFVPREGTTLAGTRQQ